MPPKFGTSGLRGLVTELTPECVRDHLQAFAAACPMGTGLYVGHDLRVSSPALASSVQDAALAAGLDVTICGAVSTPALALAAITAGAAAVMVTGSHIPADRNGLKFYTPTGEITKLQEQAILDALGGPQTACSHGQTAERHDIMARYDTRYASAFTGGLTGLRIGVFMHSAVGRDHLAALLQRLGADVVALGRTDAFVPVDTEAVSDAFRADFKAWAALHRLDAIVSTDADGDRPLLTDHTGKVVPGDILGQITARLLGAETVVTPVSSNAGAELSQAFATVRRTKIGSPFVLAEMEKFSGQVVGFEANGGFILGSDVQGPSGPITRLMTRDAVLPILSVLSAAAATNVAALVAQEPPCVTAADRLQDIDPLLAQALLQELATDAAARKRFLADLGKTEERLDLTDGLRMVLKGTDVLHLRLSGNAPELRVYVEAADEAQAGLLLRAALRKLDARLGR